MTFPADWWITTDLEDEPCDSCGIKPSKHEGHGSFTCETCYNARWCPKCSYLLGLNHVCPSKEQQEADRKAYEEWKKGLDL